MNSFRIFSILSTALTYLLIFVGGMVRVAGAGMGCPDWPKCFGRWIPPTSLNQLPDYIDSAKFNLVLAWIEYSNRLFGALVGLTIAITLYLGIKHYSHLPRIKWTLIIAFILTLFEGWLGAVLVETILNPITITLHLFFAIVIVMLLLYASQEAYYLKNPQAEEKSQYPKNMQILFGIMAFSLLVEVVLGTEIRGGLEMIRKENPMVESQFLLDMLGPFKYAHSVLGFLITILSIIIWYGLVRKSLNPSPLMVQTSTGVVLLIFLQIVLGEILVFLEVIPIIQLFHLWIASWILGLVSVQYVAWRRSILIHD
ncbi:MAG: COX15/CtaA family protein [Candidatus Neomarinimicrobiota bacterium]